MLCYKQINMNGCTQWNQLFDENVAEIWREEPNSMLKSLSMMVFCINREIKQIQDNLQLKIHSIRNQLKDNPAFVEKTVQIPLDGGLIGDTVQSKLCKSTQCSSGQLASVNSSTHRDQSNNNSQSIIISDEDLAKSDEGNGSPEIKKNRRCYRYKQKMLRRYKENDSTVSKSKLMVITTNAQQSDDSNEQAESHSLNLLLPFNVPKAVPVELHQSFKREISTPQKFDNDMDFSVIESTPVIKPVSLRTREIKRGLKDKRLTLTQILPTNDQEANNTLQYKNHSSNQEGESVMGITNMVNYLNNDTSPNTTPDCPRLEENRYLNSGIFEGNLNLTNEQVHPGDLNDFLAKAQDVPNQLEAEPVVRGSKLRQKLPGWSCKNCENFYLKQGLNANEILALTKKCTKHRGYYMPREDTPPGLWNLTMVTQESENT